MCRERERDRERKSSVYLLWILSLSINIDDFNKHRNTSEHVKKHSMFYNSSISDEIKYFFMDIRIFWKIQHYSFFLSVLQRKPIKTNKGKKEEMKCAM